MVTIKTVFPGGAALNAFGANMKDLSARKPTVPGGHGQRKTLADELIGF